MAESYSYVLPKERDTKNTTLFKGEVNGRTESIYVPKTAMEKLGNPAKVKVTIEAAE